MGMVKSKPMVKDQVLKIAPGTRPAASLILVAPNTFGTLGFKVLMIKRTRQMSFMPDMYVFPGGKVDLKDEQETDNEEFEEYHHRMTLMPHRVAAIRETYEETGYALDQRGQLKEKRYQKLQYKGGAFEELIPYQHWITPEQEKKRFDTWFFLKEVDEKSPQLVPDAEPGEVADVRWVDPKEALKLHKDRDSDFKLPPPTLIMMLHMAKFPTAGVLIRDAQVKADRVEKDMIPHIQPILEFEGGLHMHLRSTDAPHMEDGVHKFPMKEQDLFVHVGSEKFGTNIFVAHQMAQSRLALEREEAKASAAAAAASGQSKL